MYLLDTNTVIARLGGDARVVARLRALSSEDVILCAPVVAELVFGAALSARRAENLARVARLATSMRAVPFNEYTARRFGELKAALRQRGVSIADFDLAIAATALEWDAVLVTHDRALHDAAIPDLSVEDWLEPEPR